MDNLLRSGHWSVTSHKTLIFQQQFQLRKALLHFSRLKGLNAKEAKQNTQELLEKVGLRDARLCNDRQLSHGMRKGLRLLKLSSPMPHS